MVQINTFDYGRAINQGTQNALNTLKARQGISDMQRQNAIRGAFEGGASNEQAANTLRQQGYGMAANKLSQQAQEQQDQSLQRELTQMQLVQKTAPMARDQRSWDMVREKWVKFGADPETLPEEFDPEFVRHMAGKAQEDLEIMTKNLPGGMAQDYTQQGRQLQPFGEPYERYSPSAMETDGGGGLKSSDENSMHRYAAGLYGGTYDPQTGQITGLNPDQSRNVLAMSTRAAQLLSGREVGTRSEAVSQAARELGIDVPDLGARQGNQASADQYVQERFGGGERQPGPTRERAQEQGQGRVIRFDEQGNRVD